MVDLAHNLIQTEILLESSMLGTLIASYLFLLLVIFVSFLNIYSVDKFEFLNNQQYLPIQTQQILVKDYYKPIAQESKNWNVFLLGENQVG